MACRLLEKVVLCEQLKIIYNFHRKGFADNMKKVELLAPAGSFDALRAAVNAGADAVYMGGTKFGARAYADNPDEDGMIKAIEFCHLRGKKLYMTVNTLFKEEELLDGLYAFLKPYYEAGLDAVIVQDMGAVSFISEHFPGLDIHLSTQCTITMAEGAAQIRRETGAEKSITRLVPARELSIEELKEMRAHTKLEIEVFIHGALCYCYSGQCLLSSMAGGRSGNRGRCAQPCRRLYSTENGAGYYLSPRDMCTLEKVHELLEAGIDSLKIEGRMKSPEYVAGVVAVYREFIDRFYEMGAGDYRSWLEKNRTELDAKLDLLRELYNRGGFNEGYLEAHNGQAMMSLTRPNHSGIKVGSVVKCEGRKAIIRLERPARKGDVLEIRSDVLNANGTFKGEKALYEFTLGENYSSGVILSVLTMKDRTATPGLEVFRTKNDTLLRDIRDKYIERDSKCPVKISFYAEVGRPSELSLSCAKDILLNDDRTADIGVSVKGNIVDAAKNAPTAAADVKKQLEKLGESDFVSTAADIRLEGNVFLPVGELNRLRREATALLRERLIKSFTRSRSEAKTDRNSAGVQGQELKEEAIGKNGCTAVSSCISSNIKELSKAGGYLGSPDINVLVSDPVQLKKALTYDFVRDIYFDISAYEYAKETSVFDAVAELCSAGGRRLFFALPYIIRSSSYASVRRFVEKYSDRAGFLVRNHEGAELVGSFKGEVRYDYQLYAMNSMAAGLSARAYTVSPELNAREIEAVAGENSELVIYGLMPVMYSAQCVYKNVKGSCSPTGRCESVHGLLTLGDEKGYSFPSVRLCRDCYNIIYNSSVLNLLHRYEEVLRTGNRRLRLNFTYEKGSETGLILDCMGKVIEGDSYLLPDEVMGMKFTNGHFCRGVE